MSGLDGSQSFTETRLDLSCNSANSGLSSGNSDMGPKGARVDCDLAPVRVNILGMQILEILIGFILDRI
jgi:hypothetical protein